MSDISRFSFPTTILYGGGAVSRLPEALRELAVTKPLLVTDAALSTTPVLDRVLGVLSAADVPTALFSGVHPNPLDANVTDALQVYRDHGCDGIIGLGGGSPLDAAKALAVLVANGGEIADYDVQTGGADRIRKQLPPVVGVPTTAGTGSEVGKCAVITSGALHRKFMVCHPWMLPARAILDPELTVSLPAHLTAATGMDALTHCVESLTAPVFHPLCDAIALKGIEYVAENLEKAVTDPDDLEARGRMLLAAAMGAVAFQKDLGAAHSISHALSAVAGTQHGLANAILLPPVMEFNYPAAASLYALIPPYFGVSTAGMETSVAAETAVREIRALNDRIGIPPALRDLRIDRGLFDEIVEKAYRDPCHRTNVRACTADDLRSILEAAWEGRSR